jgi:8-oxo-dGTP pyrophosphatase MutT (NUDIX family)
MAEPPPASRPPVAGGKAKPPAAWLNVSQTQVADCRVFRVQRRRLRHASDGREGDFYIIEAPDWVITLPLTSKQELILVRQWRFGVEQLSWEPPGGVMDPGEDPVTAGQRELLEETGYAGSPVCVLGQAAPNPAIQNNHAHFILVENCVPKAALHWDPHEELETGIFPLAEVEQMIRRGEIFHSIALNAVQFLQMHLAARSPHS